MKNILTIALLFSCFFTQAQELVTYVHPTKLFSLKYPAKWTSEMGEKGRVYFVSPVDTAADDVFDEQIYNDIQKDKSYKSILDIKFYVKHLPEVIENAFIGFSMKSQKQFKVNGNEVIEIIFNGRSKATPEQMMQVRQWFLVKDGYLFTFTYSKEHKATNHDEEALAILNSIELN